MIFETRKSDVVTNKGTGLVIPTVASALKINSIEGKSVQNGTPTPDAKVDIESVDLQVVKATGKNLISCNKESRTINGITFTVNPDKSITINGTSTAKATLIVADSVTLDVGSYIFGSNYRPYNVTCAVDQKKNNTWELVAASHGAEFEVTKENKNRTFSFYFSVNSGVTVNNVTVYPMLRKSNTNNTYVPYQGENKLTLSAPVTLMGKGNVKDAICEQGNVVSVLRKFKKLNFTTIRSVLNETNTIRYFIDLPDYVVGSNGGSDLLCNALPIKNVYSLDEPGVIVIASNKVLTIRLPKSVLADETQATFLKYLQDNVELYYSAAPVFEPLPDADQKLFNSLRSYDGVTVITTDSTVEPELCVTNAVSLTGAYALDSVNALGGCYFKREGDKFYIGYDDGTAVTEMEV